MFRIVIVNNNKYLGAFISGLNMWLLKTRIRFMQGKNVPQMSWARYLNFLLEQLVLAILGKVYWPQV